MHAFSMGMDGMGSRDSLEDFPSRGCVGAAGPRSSRGAVLGYLGVQGNGRQEEQFTGFSARRGRGWKKEKRTKRKFFGVDLWGWKKLGGTAAWQDETGKRARMEEIRAEAPMSHG
jgi:hypothetical protein